MPFAGFSKSHQTAKCRSSVLAKVRQRQNAVHRFQQKLTNGIMPFIGFGESHQTASCRSSVSTKVNKRQNAVRQFWQKSANGKSVSQQINLKSWVNLANGQDLPCGKSCNGCTMAACLGRVYNSERAAECSFCNSFIYEQAQSSKTPRFALRQIL